MGQAREVMDRLTEAAMKGDFDTLASLHADDAVSVTPDQGELVGRQQAVDYLMGFRDAFPDLAWESLHSHESGDTAIDEGYVIGTHTQTLQVPVYRSLCRRPGNRSGYVALTRSPLGVARSQAIGTTSTSSSS